MYGIEKINLIAAWCSILFGLTGGLAQGMFFHNENWLGGYGSWKRRLMRLGHISFFGLAFLNLAFVQFVSYFNYRGDDLQLMSTLYLVGLVSMPTVCYACAFMQPLRWFFAIPIISLIWATGTVVYRVLQL